jgi:hypothetical protein
MPGVRSSKAVVRLSPVLSQLAISPAPTSTAVVPAGLRGATGLVVAGGLTTDGECPPLAAVEPLSVGVLLSVLEHAVRTETSSSPVNRHCVRIRPGFPAHHALVLRAAQPAADARARGLVSGHTAEVVLAVAEATGAHTTLGPVSARLNAEHTTAMGDLAIVSSSSSNIGFATGVTGVASPHRRRPSPSAAPAVLQCWGAAVSSLTSLRPVSFICGAFVASGPLTICSAARRNAGRARRAWPTSPF